MASITSANATLMVSVGGLYEIPQTIQGWASDDAFASESAQIVESLMGIDGTLSGGFVHRERKMSITLQADSPSIRFFDNWAQAQEAALDIYWANAILTLPGPHLAYALRKGLLEGYSVFSDVKKVLSPRKFQLVFERIFVTPTA
jgi:hypothetical protein